MRTIICSLFIGQLLAASPLWADGGAVRWSQREGNYQITVLTAPTPLRAGPIDISVLVQNAENYELVREGRVAVTATPRVHRANAICRVATTEAATNKLYRATEFELREPGWWDVELSIDGPLGSAHTQFEMEAAPPLPIWLAMWPWFCWPAFIIVLFGVHHLVVRSERGQHPKLSLKPKHDLDGFGRAEPA